MQCYMISVSFIASQLWCLGRLFPLIIYDLIAQVDNAYWDNFLSLLSIIDCVFAPTLSKRIASYLTYMIEDHLMQFKELYPNCPIIPKQHYLIHIPQWIVR